MVKAGSLEPSVVQIEKRFPSSCTRQDAEMSQLSATGPSFTPLQLRLWVYSSTNSPAKLNVLIHLNTPGGGSDYLLN